MSQILTVRAFAPRRVGSMKAQVLTAESGPDGLQLTEVDDPTPGAGQVLVDIK